MSNEGDKFYEGVVAPLMGQLAKEAHADIEYWLGQVPVVASVVQREQVRRLRKEVDTDMGRVAQGANPRRLFAKLVDIVAERDGPTPFLGRMLAARAIGQLGAGGEIDLDRTDDPMVSRLLDSTLTDPFPRGSLLLHAAIESQLRRDEILHQATTIRSAHQSGRRRNWLTDELLSTNEREEAERWKRHEMAAHATRILAEMGSGQFEMGLFNWLGMVGTAVLGADAKPGDPLIPKSLIRMGPREWRDAEGRKEEAGRLCSQTLQLIAAAAGVPRRTKMAEGTFDWRNITSLLVYRTVRSLRESGMGLARVLYRGVAMDPVRVLSGAERDMLERKIHDQRGGLQDRDAIEHVPADLAGLWVAVRAVRMVSSLGPEQRRGAIGGEIEKVLNILDRPAKVEVIRSGRTETWKGSVLGSWRDEYNSQRGRLEGRLVTVEKMHQSVRLAATAMAVELRHGLSVVREEPHIWQLAREIIARRGVSEEDKLNFPRLLQDGQLRVETIRRVQAPEGTAGLFQVEDVKG